MKDDRLYDQLRTLAWRRKLTAAEDAQLRAWLTSHPDETSDWEAESTLNEGLAQLPDIPLPSNFTAVVLERARLERQQTANRLSGIGGWWCRVSWVPRLGFAAIVLALALVSYKGVQETQRRQLVRSAGVVAELATVPSPEALKDFDAISKLTSTPAPDLKLLSLLQ